MLAVFFVLIARHSLKISIGFDTDFLNKGLVMCTTTDILSSLTDLIFPTKGSQLQLGEVEATEYVASQFFASIGTLSRVVFEKGTSVFLIATETEVNPGFFNFFVKHFPGMVNETNTETIKATLLLYLLDSAEKKIQLRSCYFALDEKGVLIKRNL